MPELTVANTSPLFYLQLKPVIEKLLTLNFRLKPELVKAILEFAEE